MVLSCIISEIKRDIGRKSRFFHTLAFDDAVRRSSSEYAIPFGTEKLEWCGYPTIKKSEDMYNRFDRMPACDRQTDRQTD